VRLGFVQAAVTERRKLKEELVKVESLEDEFLQNEVNSVPEEFLPKNERRVVSDFLIARKGKLRSLASPCESPGCRASDDPRLDCSRSTC
jgi:hypothetical protein